MNIYVAARFTEKELARTTMTTLEADGHAITSDWTIENDHESNYPQEVPASIGRGIYLQDCAEKCIQGVLEADVVLVLNHETGAGLFVEVGLALGYGKKLVVVNPTLRDIPFWYLPEVTAVPTLEEAYLEINSYENMGEYDAEQFLEDGPPEEEDE